MNSTSIMTQKDIKRFAMSTGGMAQVISYLNPLLGDGVQPTATASNHIIARNG